MNKLSLYIDGKPHKFYSASLSYSIDNLAHTFSCQIEYKTIVSALKVEFKLNQETIMIGQIDSVNHANTDGNKLTINGRSISCNMIDSSIKINVIYNQKFDQLLKTIISPFGLKVDNQVKGPLQEILEFQLNAESPLSNLAQLAKQQNLIITEHNGTIVIERPGQFEVKNIGLQEGKNIKDVTISQNFTELFYTYEVQGMYDGAEAKVTYKASNTNRIKTIIADKLHDSQSCQKRAEYERNLAIAKGLTFNGKVPGLHTELTGKIINKLIEASTPNFKEKLLVKNITLSVNPTGQNTQITLFRPFGETNA